MCSLCGALGYDDHWTSAIARPGVFTPGADALSRRREGARRLKLANAILKFRRLSLREWSGTTFLLATATGKTEVFEALSHLWPVAENLAGAVFDPLDERLMTFLEEEEP